MRKDGTKKVMVGSLYPSIDQKEGPRLVEKEIMESKLQFKNINYHLATVYLG